MQQNKNFMLFCLLSICIFASCVVVQNTIWPRKKAPEKQVIDENRQAELARACFLLAGNQADWLSVGVKDLVKWLPPKATLPAEKPDNVVKEPKLPPEKVDVAVKGHKPPVEKEPTVIHLGGPKHHIEALLTTRGAGVQKLVLNKFRAADYLGLPYTGEYEDAKLELIPEDPIQPSYLLYHYKDFTTEAVPVDTLGKLIWNLDKKPASADEDSQEARFSVDVPGTQVRITKTYTLNPGAYHVELTLAIADLREKGEPVKFRYQMTGSNAIPVEGEWFATAPRTAVTGTVNAKKYLHRDQEEALRISFMSGGNRIPEADLAPESFIQYSGIMNQFFCSLLVVDSDQAKLKNNDDPKRFLAWVRPTLESSEVSGILLSNDEPFLTIVPTPDHLRRGPVTFRMLPRVLKHINLAEFKAKERVMVSFYQYGPEKIATWIRRGETPRGMLDDITVRVISQELSLKPGEKIQHKYVLYNGPSKVKLLSQFTGDASVPAELIKKYNDTLQLHTVTDFGRFYWWSDLIIACTNLMHFLLNHLRVLGDGLSIVLLTVLVRGLMFPISRKQAIYSVKMQDLAPEMKKIQEKFKNDPRARTEAIMELYRKHNVHPLGGCLPILLQMPIFIGLYFSLQESVHFRLASFMWIRNLAAPDMMIWWTESIPIISDPNGQGGAQGLSTFLRFFYLGPFFNLLPVIAITFMIIQQAVMTPPPQDEQQEAQFKMMRYMMVVIGVMFYKVAAGLCMYIIISTVWGLAERRFLPKKKAVLAVPEPAPGGQRSGPSGKKQPVKALPKKPDGRIQKVKDWWQEVLKQARKK